MEGYSKEQIKKFLLGDGIGIRISPAVPVRDHVTYAVIEDRRGSPTKGLIGDIILHISYPERIAAIVVHDASKVPENFCNDLENGVNTLLYGDDFGDVIEFMEELATMERL